MVMLTTSLKELYCGKCRKLVNKNTMHFVKKADAWWCEDCK